MTTLIQKLARKEVSHCPNYVIFHLTRASYGKLTTPFEKREFTVDEFPTMAVGTINEIADFLKEKGYKLLHFVVKDILDKKRKVYPMSFDFETEE